MPETIEGMLKQRSVVNVLLGIFTGEPLVEFIQKL